MSKVLISVGTYQLISSLEDDDELLLLPQAARTVADNKVTAPRPIRFQFLISIMGSSYHKLSFGMLTIITQYFLKIQKICKLIN